MLKSRLKHNIVGYIGPKIKLRAIVTEEASCVPEIFYINFIVFILFYLKVDLTDVFFNEFCPHKALRGSYSIDYTKLMTRIKLDGKNAAF